MRVVRTVFSGLALGMIAVVGVVQSATAHAVVYPSTSTPGAYEKYVLRVPNERDVATTRVEIRFPASVRVVSFGEVPGWTVEPVTDAAGRITAAIWTGTLPPRRFVEFPFIAVNPDVETRLTWPAVQTYADGEVVDWAGPEGSDAPASFTMIEPAEGAGGSGAALPIAVVAGLLALIGLGLAIRR